MTEVYNESEELSVQEQKDELEYERSLIEEPIMRRAFNMWRQFTKDRIEEQIEEEEKENIREAAIEIESSLTELQDDILNNLLVIVRNNNSDSSSLANSNIQETIEKFDIACLYIDNLLKDIKNI